MNIGRTWKRYIHLVAIGLTLVFLSIMLLPVFCVKAEENASYNDFDAFSSAFSSMLQFDKLEGDQSVAAAALNQDNTSAKESQQEQKTQLNRLIITKDGNVEDYGAVAKAEYKDTHIFQYANPQSAQFAYQNLKAGNISVSFDAVTTANDFVVDTAYTYSSNPALNATYLSWGADFVGYKNYVSNMYKANVSANNTFTANEVVVAVLDSGINASHSLFDGRILTEYARNFTDEDNSGNIVDTRKVNVLNHIADLNGHGSHTSGTIADNTLDNVKILPLKVLRGDGKGTVSMITAALAYIENLVANKAANNLNIKTFNMSIGIELSNGSASNPELENAVKRVYRAGVMPVLSAGNDSVNTRFTSPANVDEEAIVVSALKQTSATTVAFDKSYSNFGSTVDFAAPGTSIRSAGKSGTNSVATLSGTSMAAPHVASAVALIYSNPIYTDFSLAQVYDLLKKNAVDIGDVGKDDYYGYGCINIENIGITVQGDVAFSTLGGSFNSDERIGLTLAYDMEEVSDVKIYYTTNPYAKTADHCTTAYTGKININSTTKITAVAYGVNKNNQLVSSKVTSQTYVFDNIDVISNFEFTDYGTGGFKVKKYNGNLTTLNLPSYISNVLISSGTTLTYKKGYVYAIGTNAFTGSKLEEITLPSYVTVIQDSAFAGLDSLHTVHFADVQLKTTENRLTLSRKAFYQCASLQNFDADNVMNVISIGELAFGYCKSLQSLKFMSTANLGVNAITGCSALKVIYLGKYVNSISSQINLLSLETVYGYSAEGKSASQKFAEEMNVNFVDLSIAAIKPLQENYVVKSGKSTQFTICYFGYLLDVKYRLSLQNVSYNSCVTAVAFNQGEFETEVTFEVFDLGEGEYTFDLVLEDAYATQKKFSSVIKVQDEASEVKFVGEEEKNYQVYIKAAADDVFREISDGNFLTKGSYDVRILPQNGYQLDEDAFSVVGANAQIDQKTSSKIEFSIEVVAGANLQFAISASERPVLQVNFATKNGAGTQILVDGQVVENVSVNRGGSVDFSINSNGLQIKYVLVDDMAIRPSSDGTYTISNIVKDIEVEVVFVERVNNVYVVCGQGAEIYRPGENFMLAYSKTQEIVITPEENYTIDFVTINGEKVDVKKDGNNYVFNVTNNTGSSDEEISVVISLKKTKASIFAQNSVFMYFIVILAVFAVLILAKLWLFVFRKLKKDDVRG